MADSKTSVGMWCWRYCAYRWNEKKWIPQNPVLNWYIMQCLAWPILIFYLFFLLLFFLIISNVNERTPGYSTKQLLKSISVGAHLPLYSHEHFPGSVPWWVRNQRSVLAYSPIQSFYSKFPWADVYNIPVNPWQVVLSIWNEDCDAPMRDAYRWEENGLQKSSPVKSPNFNV